MPELQEKPKDQFCFELGQFAVEQPVEGKKKRTFTGVAYSGEPILDHWYWDRVIFDLDSIQIKGRIPALLEHRSSQRAGAINSHSIDYAQGLVISGDLMSNEFGSQVAQDSDDGFPWQMSVRIEPSSTEDIAADQAVTVNGKTYQGPITVFRGGRIREVSFCALGADDNTSAVAASHNPTQPTKEGTNVTELEQAKAKIQELEQKNTQLESDVKKFAAEKREAEITALTAETKTEFSVEEKAEMAKLDDAAFAFSAAQIRKFSANSTLKKQGLPDHLTKHQAGGDPAQNQFNAKPMSLADQAKARK
ncbi:hypothetical protein [Acinetobacter sp. UBA6571]|uniref:hypothetical protein n=1 Tax=Acinetobacter sp. UBA6571 TaxID=1945951 RepID=UPI00257ED880|nr:hypothetical protein [Acinetobacter sp. UBA6571]